MCGGVCWGRGGEGGRGEGAAELLWGAAKQRASGMYFVGRKLIDTRLHLRIGFYGGLGPRAGVTWARIKVAGCWTTAMTEMNKWIDVDTTHVGAKGLSGTITDLAGAANWATSDESCLDITDMHCAADPAPVDAAVLQVGPADEEVAGVDEESSAEEEE